MGRMLVAIGVVASLLILAACTSSDSTSGGDGQSCGSCALMGTDGQCRSCGAGTHPTLASATDLHGCGQAAGGVTCCPGSCSKNTAGVTDFIASISNGPTLAAANSYWVSQVHCNEGDGLKFVIAADGTAQFGTNAFSWTRTAPDGMLFGAAPDGGAVFFSQLKNIYGSVADGSFTGVLLDVSGGHAGCSYSLVGGKL